MTATRKRGESAAILAKLRRQLARQDLIAFCKYVDPLAAERYSARHMRKIAKVLERVERGEIKRLFITAPPRHWKSSLSVEKFVQYFLGRNPLKTAVIASNAASLAEGFSRNVRDNVAANPRFAELFPETRLNPEFSSVKEWALEGAYRASCRAVGVGGSIVGKGADLMLIDDPVADFKEANSKTQREAVWNWYRETIRDRLEPGGAIILVMSRWHADDLAGRLMAASKAEDGEEWFELRLPAIAEEHDEMGRAVGEALWPEKWPIEELEKIKKAQGNRGFSAKFQGSPRPDDGNVLDHTQLVIIEQDKLPHSFEKLVRRWDLAFSEKAGADYVAGMRMGIDASGNVYLLHLNRIQGRWPQAKPKIIEQSITDGIATVCAIEANGTQLGYFQDVQDDKRMQSRTVVADHPEGTKEMRASVWGSRLEDKIIYCVRAPWNQILFDEMDFFTATADHDDIIDSISGGWNLLKVPDGGFSTPDDNRNERVSAKHASRSTRAPVDDDGEPTEESANRGRVLI